MSSKISRWIGPALAVAWVVLFVAISSAEAQIKFTQRGFVLMDYKVGINTSQADRDFSKKESSDFGTTRFRIWNNWKLGEFANAEWMFEADTVLGVAGPKAGSPAAGPLRGDRINLETGIARLDITVPTTDWHVRIGQQSFFTVLPMFQERVPGIKIYKAGGKIKPTIFFIPEEKTFANPGVKDQINDDQIAGGWLDILPMKGVKIQPFFMWQNQQNESPDPTTTDVGPFTIDLATGTFVPASTTTTSGKFDFQRASFGFNSEYKTKGWYVNYLVVGQAGEKDFDGTTKDRDISAWATEFGAGYNWGVNTFSLNFIHRSGQNARDSGDITVWQPIVTFFANKNRTSQLLTTVNQHPAFDLEIADTTGPNNSNKSGWTIFGLWWKRPINKQTLIELGYTHIRSAKEIDTDGDKRGDSRHVGDAFDLLLNYKVTKGLTFYTGTAFMIPGDGLDAPNGSGGSSDAVCCPWQLFTSAILRF